MALEMKWHFEDFIYGSIDGAVTTFAMVNLSVILLQYREPSIERQFKIPINIGKFSLLPLFGVIISAYMMTQFNAYVISIGIGVIVAGALFYALSKKHMTKTSQP